MFPRRARLDQITESNPQPKADQPEADDIESFARDLERAHAGREDKEQWPGDGDDDPGRLVMNDAVGREDAHPVNGEIADDVAFEKLAGQAKHQPDEDGPLVAHRQLEPVGPRFFMPVAFRARLIPNGKSLVEAFHARPVQERPRIEKDDEKNAGPGHDREIHPVPLLPGPFHLRHWRQPMGDLEHDARDQRATNVNDVGLLGQDHPRDADPDAPEISARPEAPEPEQPEHEKHREKQEPDFVNRVAPVKNEAGRNRHRQGRNPARPAPDERLEF